MFTTTVATRGATTYQILALRDFLLEHEVTTVVTEATSDCWKPFYFVFNDVLPVRLVNAKQARNIPGRKTDVSDAAWLAQLAAHGLLRACFVPPAPIRELRDLTRARTIATEDRSREAQRLEKFLESTGIKLSATASDLLGVSSRAMLDALVAGERSPQILAELAKGRMRAKIPELVEALIGRFTKHHAFICRMHLERIDHLSNWIEQLTERVDEAMQPFLPARDFLTTIPGVSTLVADVLVAESGADMGRFEETGHLCSWAGITPGHHQSAGRVLSAHTWPGNRYLKGALGVAALVIARRPKDTYLGARYQRLVIRRGKPKALVATERSILTAVWHMLANGECYHEVGADFFALKDLNRARRNAVRRLQELDFDVELTAREAA